MPDLLARLTALAALTPCRVARADLLRLLDLAGLGATHTFEVITESEADPVTVEPAGLVEIMWMAQKELKRQALLMGKLT